MIGAAKGPVFHGRRATNFKSAGQLDYFVSRRGASAAVAQEVADVLGAADYTVLVQDYDIPQGANFVVAMHDALKRCRHFIALLSKDYDSTPFTIAEWTNFYAIAAHRAAIDDSSCCASRTATRKACSPRSCTAISSGSNIPTSAGTAFSPPPRDARAPLRGGRSCSRTSHRPTLISSVATN